MIHDHAGADTRDLFEELAATLQPELGPQAGPLAAPIVLVPSTGLARWLRLRLAERFGICAGLQLPFIASWLGELHEQLLDKPEGALLTTRTLPVALLGEEASRGQDRRAARRARQLAAHFDRMLVYQPQEILRWQAGEGQGLADSWRALVTRGGPRSHRAARLQELYHRLRSRSGAELCRSLPRQLHVFRPMDLPPAQKSLLEALGEHLQLHLYLPRRSAQCPAIGGSAARAWREAEAFAERATAPEGPREGSLLQRIQDAHLRGAEPEAGRRAIDNSLQFFSCHTPLREVECLAEALLRLLQEHPHLGPEDIQLRLGDLALYAPALQQVFHAGGPLAGLLPMALPGAAGDEDPAGRFLQRLLALGEWEGRPDQLLDFLSPAALARRFDLEESDRAPLRRLLAEGGLTFGLDENHRQELGHAALREGSWDWLLERLLLGRLAAPGEGDQAAPLLEGEGAETLRPLCSAGVESGRRLGGLIELVSSIARWRSFLREAASLVERLSWLDGRLQQELRPETDAEVASLRRWSERLAELEQEARRQPLEGNCEAGALLELLSLSSASRPPQEAGGQDGRITAGSLTSLRGVPARVVALLGMSDAAFPRSSASHELESEELPLRDPRREDLALFEDSLLSAQEHLLCFWQGQDARSGEQLAPGLPLRELLEEVRLVCGKDPVQQEFLHPWHPDYFGKSAKGRSHDKSLADLRKRGKDPALLDRIGLPFRLPDGDPPSTLPDLASCLAWLQHPPRRELRALGLRLAESGKAEEVGFFELKGLAGWQLRAALWPPADDKNLEGRLRADGLLPGGSLGEALLEEASARQLEIIDFVRSISTDAFSEHIPVLIDSRALPQGSLPLPAAGSPLLSLQTGRLKEKHKVTAWLQHLLRHAAGLAAPQDDCLLVSFDEKPKGLRFKAPQRPAAELLRPWLSALPREDGRLLPFHPDLSTLWFLQQKRSGETAAEEALQAAWEDGFQTKGLGRDPWLRLVFGPRGPLGDHALRQAFCACASTLLQELEAHEGEL